MAFEEEIGKKDLRTVMVSLIIGAFGFLVALAWRDAIQQTIDLFVPKGEGLGYTYLAAILVTLIAIVVSFAMLRLQKIERLKLRNSNNL